MHITVTLEKKNRKTAIEAMKKRGLHVIDNFLGPVFEYANSYNVSKGCLCIVLDDGALYWYPLHTVARIKVVV